MERVGTIDKIDSPTVGNYPLGIVSRKSFAANYYNIGINCQYETDSINTGMLTITHYSITTLFLSFFSTIIFASYVKNKKA
jgi:hypothetical protein